MQIKEIVLSIIAKLDYVKSLPIDELETGLDEIQLKLIDLRDRLIESLRQGRSGVAARSELCQINLALSLIFGLEYPVTGFQRNKIDQAAAVLQLAFIGS